MTVMLDGDYGDDVEEDYVGAIVSVGSDYT